MGRRRRAKCARGLARWRTAVSRLGRLPSTCSGRERGRQYWVRHATLRSCGWSTLVLRLASGCGQVLWEGQTAGKEVGALGSAVPFPLAQRAQFGGRRRTRFGLVSKGVALTACWMSQDGLGCSPVTCTTGAASCSVVGLPAERARLRSQHMDGAMQLQRKVNAVLLTDSAIETGQLGQVTLLAIGGHAA